MQNVRRAVEGLAQPVPAIVTHYRIAVLFGIGLYRMPDMTDRIAGPHLLYAQHGCFIGNLAQAFGFDGRLADPVHAAGVAVPAIDDDGNVDIDDIAVFEFQIARDAVADHVIDRSAD